MIIPVVFSNGSTATYNVSFLADVLINSAYNSVYFKDGYVEPDNFIQVIDNFIYTANGVFTFIEYTDKLSFIKSFIISNIKYYQKIIVY